MDPLVEMLWQRFLAYEAADVAAGGDDRPGKLLAVSGSYPEIPDNCRLA